MNTQIKFWQCAMGIVGLGLNCQSAHAQTMYLDPPRAPWTGGVITFSLMVDFGIADAIGWGTDIDLNNPGYPGAMSFVQDFGGVDANGVGIPFFNTRPDFFNLDISDYSESAFGRLHLDFININPPATLGNNGQVMLGQFQVKVNQDPGTNGLDILLSPVDIPPAGSAVQDHFTNNILIDAQGAHITKTYPSPEPGGVLTMIGGGIGAIWLLRRKRRVR